MQRPNEQQQRLSSWAINYCTTHWAATEIDFPLWVPNDWLSVQKWSSHHPENREVSHKLDSYNE